MRSAGISSIVTVDAPSARNPLFNSAKFAVVCLLFAVVAFLCMKFIRFKRDLAQNLFSFIGSPCSAVSPDDTLAVFYKLLPWRFWMILLRPPCLLFLGTTAPFHPALDQGEAVSHISSLEEPRLLHPPFSFSYTILPYRRFV